MVTISNLSPFPAVLGFYPVTLIMFGYSSWLMASLLGSFPDPVWTLTTYYFHMKQSSIRNLHFILPQKEAADNASPESHKML